MKGLARFLLLLLLALPAMQTGAHRAEAASATMHDMAMHEIPGHEMSGHEMPGHVGAMQDMTTHDMAMHHGVRHSEDRGAPAPSHALHHDCIGCIAPIDIRLYRPAAAPEPATARESRPAAIVFLLTRAAAPETPPPRIPV